MFLVSQKVCNLWQFKLCLQIQLVFNNVFFYEIRDISKEFVMSVFLSKKSKGNLQFRGCILPPKLMLSLINLMEYKFKETFH